MADSTASAIRDTFTSPNVADSNLEPANLVDVLDRLANATYSVARRITADAAIGTDETGGRIESLTEAVMGITAGLCRIADSIDHLASAIESHGGGNV